MLVDINTIYIYIWPFFSLFRMKETACFYFNSTVDCWLTFLKESPVKCMKEIKGWRVLMGQKRCKFTKIWSMITFNLTKYLIWLMEFLLFDHTYIHTSFSLASWFVKRLCGEGSTEKLFSSIEASYGLEESVL